MFGSNYFAQLVPGWGAVFIYELATDVYLVALKAQNYKLMLVTTGYSVILP